jgi:hypothetical protein
MNAIRYRTARVARGAYRAALLAVLILGMLCTGPVAMAAKKEKEEAAPTKSYVLPYFIVMVLLGAGLMTVCRPGTRKDKVDEKKPKQEVED